MDIKVERNLGKIMIPADLIHGAETASNTGFARVSKITDVVAEPEVREERVIWAENITYLAKEKGIKLMDLAKDVDVTVSFFSRARKGDSRADAVVLSNIAERLGVSLDLLMKVDLSAMGESEKLIAKSLNKMLQDTVSEKIRWERFRQHDSKALGSDGNPRFPFMVVTDVDPGERVYMEYTQPLCSDTDTAEINGDFFKATLTDCIDLYLLPIHVDTRHKEEHGESYDSLQGIDMFFVTASKEIKPMCCTYKGTRPEIVQKVIELHQMILKKAEQALLDSFTSDLLTDYLNDRLDQRQDPPF